ncbi:hypothetical protein LYSHEL_22110 [Lysobacter helvus]|uniref:DUF2127 domain-containing protein n=2 Tax=Lysobacteraceae TaxID=32033 RepID=A0ABM7Q712_9GAMM|nr:MULTISPECIES: hypothetical protein [Lysobacter]BCT93188.1 hypothetical protein LYSCAS_22120 [Lysobacter caseinilyticus]BCT96340.1 hypothetical protein LYSHEL_22110 [Lysobacter helvus]
MRAQSLRIVRVAASVAAIDLLFTLGYWASQDIGPLRVLQAMAAWIVGPTAASPGVARAMEGLAVHVAIYVAMTLALAAIVRAWRARSQRWFVSGATYGIAAYLVVYQGIVPWIAAPIVPSRAPDWIAACLVVHGLLLGPMMRQGLRPRPGGAA